MSINELIADNTKLIKFFSYCDCKFIAGIQHYNELPNLGYSEIAFIGRSNVGKSTLINKLVSKKKLARTSQTPGCTQQINLFLIDKRFVLSDLPGYGYAKASKKDRQRLQELIFQYLANRRELKITWLLLDSRLGITKIDSEVMKLFSKFGIAFRVILTKTDKISTKELNDKVEAIKNLASEYPSMYYEVFTNSKQVANDIDAIREAIVEVI